MSYLSRLKTTETPIQGAVSEKQKRLSREVPKLTQTYQGSQAANDTTAEAGRRVLAELARELNYPLPSLLEWYAGDLSDFATMPKEQARLIVADHIGTRPEALPDAAMEKRRRYVLRMLEQNPEITRAWVADGGRVCLAVRGVGTCELSIQPDKWDEFKFLELLEKQEGEA